MLTGRVTLFRPRTVRPPIYVGGAGVLALRRVIRFGDGWMPMTGDPERLAPGVARLRELAAEAGRAVPEVIAFTGFDAREPERVPDRIAALVAAGATRLVAGARYATADDFAPPVEVLAQRGVPAPPRRLVGKRKTLAH